jgi:hypothetical protein
MHAARLGAVEASAEVVIAGLTQTRRCGHAATVTLVRVHALAAQAGHGSGWQPPRRRRG